VGFCKDKDVERKQLIDVKLTKKSHNNKLNFYEMEILNNDTNAICILSSWYHKYDLKDTIQLAYYNRSHKSTNFPLFYSVEDAVDDPMILPLKALVLKPGMNIKITISLAKKFRNDPTLLIEYMALTRHQLENFKDLIKPPGWYESFHFNQLTVPLK
jgi:hypothetical protein